jgi:hypothetical protein
MTPVSSCASEFVGQLPPLLLLPELPVLPELLVPPELLALPELLLTEPLLLPPPEPPLLPPPESLPPPELLLTEESPRRTPPSSVDWAGLDDPQAMIPEARPAQRVRLQVVWA